MMKVSTGMRSAFTRVITAFTRVMRGVTGMSTACQMIFEA
jgi:hypothetical protein